MKLQSNQSAMEEDWKNEIQIISVRNISCKQMKMGLRPPVILLRKKQRIITGILFISINSSAYNYKMSVKHLSCLMPS